MAKDFIPLKDLEVYKLRELSKIGWEIYQDLDWQDKKTMGDQFVRAADSIGANITEGYFRYHYLDRVKFMYNARGSLAESKDYWLDLLFERQKVSKGLYQHYKTIAEKLQLNYRTIFPHYIVAKKTISINKYP